MLTSERVDLGKRRVQGGGLAAAGGPRYQDDAVALVDDLIHHHQVGFVETDFAQIQQDRRFIQQTHDHPLAENGWDGGEADVDILAGYLDANAPVLGEPFFSDVQSAHDFNARDDARLKTLLGAQNIIQHAVAAKTHGDIALLGFEVDIAAAFLDRLKKQRVDQPDNRRFVGSVEQVLRLFQFVGQRVEVGFFEIVDQCFSFAGASVIDSVDALEDSLPIGQHRTNRAMQQNPQLVERKGVERIGHRHHDLIRVRAQWHNQVLLGKVDRHGAHQLAINASAIDLFEQWEVELFTQSAQNIVGRGRFHRN